MKRALPALGLAALVALVLVEPALAATPAEVANNLKGQLLLVAGFVYAGIVAVVSIKFLGKRQFTDLGVFICAAIIVGAMVFAPGQFQSFVKSTANALL